MIWTAIVYYAFRWARSLSVSDAESWEGRIDLVSRVLLLTGVILLGLFVLLLCSTAYADASLSEAIADGDDGAIGYWGTMRAWLIVFSVTILVL